MAIPSLKSSLYTTRTRNGTALSASTARQAAVIIRKLAPEMTKQDHRHLASAHSAAEHRYRRLWDKAADKAAMETFGRKFLFTDYRISGIGRDEFPERLKNILRKAAHSVSGHQRLAMAHAHLAKHMRTRTNPQRMSLLVTLRNGNRTKKVRINPGIPSGYKSKAGNRIGNEIRSGAQPMYALDIGLIVARQTGDHVAFDEIEKARQEMKSCSNYREAEMLVKRVARSLGYEKKFS